MRGRITGTTLVLAISGTLLAGCSDTSTTSPTADRGGQPAETPRTVEQTVDDSSITVAVKTKLTAEKLSNAADIDVDTQRGTVTLSGTVEDGATKERAIQVARSVSGVRDVVDNLTATR